MSKKEEFLGVLNQKLSQNQGLKVYFYDEKIDKIPSGITFYHDEIELLIEVIKSHYNSDLIMGEKHLNNTKITKWEDIN